MQPMYVAHLMQAINAAAPKIQPYLWILIPVPSLPWSETGQMPECGGICWLTLCICYVATALCQPVW